MKPRRNLFAALGAALALPLAFPAAAAQSGAAPEPQKSEVRGAPIRKKKPAEPAPAAEAAKPALETVLPEKPAEEAPQMIGEFLRVGFDRLSTFHYQMPDDLLSTNAAPVTAATDQIPASIRALNKKPVALKGFMLPLKVEGGLVTEMLILRDQSMCCYGSVPKINEWVTVKMKEKGVKAVMDQAVTICGTLQVGEVRENGYLVGIYEMAGEKLAENAN